MKAKRFRHARAVLPMLAVALISACDLAPRYSRPTTPTVTAYKEAGPWVTATPGDAIPRTAWWTVFHDATLDTLETRVAQANQDLQGAIARFDEARADAREAQADFYPTIDANGSATRNHLSGNLANPLSNRSFRQYSLGPDFTYELDVWGRVRNEARAGKFRAEASAGDLAMVDLSVHAELAADYFALRGYDSEQDILDKTVQNYRINLDLTSARLKVGYARKADVSAAQAQWESVRTQAAEIRLKRAKLEHAIAILTGAPPASLSLPVQRLDAEPPAINPVLPSELLERRPDVASAERRVAAANADIGVARAAYFPTINLNALFGLAAAQTGAVFSASSEAWSYGSSASVNLFDGGRRRAINAQARARRDEAVATYRQTVLNAFGDVEDNLAALRQLAEEAQTQQAAVSAAAETTMHATDLYKGGLQSYFDVVQAQNIELQARLADVDIRTRRMTSSVLLIKALGGGWQRDERGLSAALPPHGIGR